MLRRVGTGALGAYCLAYMSYKSAPGMYGHLMAQDRLAPLSQNESLIPFT